MGQHSRRKRLWRDFGDTGWEPSGHSLLDAVPQHKAARRHAPPRRTALGLRHCGFLVGLDRGRLGWSLAWPRLWSPYEAAAEEIEARPAKHVALQHLQPVDVPFHGAATPWQRDAGFDGRIVALEAFRQAPKDHQRARCRLL